MKNSFFFFLLILLCSNRCAEEMKSIHLVNKTNKSIVILSNYEYTNYKDKFLSRDFINSRAIHINSENYIGFETFELDYFQNKNGDFVFSIYDERTMKKIDSIIVRKTNLKLLEVNSLIYK